MQTSKIRNIIKATISHIIVAFVYVLFLCAIIYFPFSNTISKAISLIDIISISSNNERPEKSVALRPKQIEKYPGNDYINSSTGDLKEYPEFGTQYGNIKIPSLNIELPLYFGDTLAILKNGIGHSSFSYFPGEGGTILCMGHNTAQILKRLPNININDQITIETVYGNYNYIVYDTRIVDEYELEAAPMQREKEILMLYTCYPVTGIGHATQRFIVYANLQK